jgi:hypothetical protein
MKQFHLSIPTPCHENWEQMTPTEQGRFCGSCQKQVIDFTQMTDQQLVAYFKKPINNVCGRLAPDQLDRTINIPAKRIPWLRYFFQFTLPAFLLSLKATAQKVERVERVTTIRSLRDTLTPLINPIVLPEKLNDPKSYSDQQIAVALGGVAGGIMVVHTPKKIKRSTFLFSNTKRDTAFNQFSVYPNPARSNGTITIDCKKMNKGEYTLKVMAINGTSVCMKPLVLEEKGGLLRTDLPTLIPGQYIITLQHTRSNKVYTEKIQVL